MTTTTTTTTATTTTTTMITTTTTYNVLARVPPRPRSCPVQPVQTQEQTKQPLPLNACADSYSTADMTTTAAMTTTTIKPTTTTTTTTAATTTIITRTANPDSLKVLGRIYSALRQFILNRRDVLVADLLDLWSASRCVLSGGRDDRPLVRNEPDVTLDHDDLGVLQPENGPFLEVALLRLCCAEGDNARLVSDHELAVVVAHLSCLDHLRHEVHALTFGIDLPDRGEPRLLERLGLCRGAVRELRRLREGAARTLNDDAGRVGTCLATVVHALAEDKAGEETAHVRIAGPVGVH